MRGENDILLPTKQFPYKAIWNQEINDFNPVCVYEYGKLVYPNLQKPYFPLSFILKFKEKIIQVIDAIGCVVVQYSENSDVQPRLEVTAFPLHPEYVFTVKHLYDPLLGTMIKGKEFTFINLPRVHPHMIKEYEIHDENEKEITNDIILCHLKKIDYDSDSYEEKYRYLFRDLKYTELNRCCDFVFSYVKHTIHGNLNKNLCLVPSIEYIEKGDIVAIIAYHANITDEWIDENYIGLKQKPTLDKLRKMFDNFNHKCVSPGIVMEAGKNYFTVDCSILPGSSGAPVFKLRYKDKTIHWIGFVLSGAKGQGYNACMSVHHPAFVDYYKVIYEKWVNIGFTNEILDKYSKMHQYLY